MKILSKLAIGLMAFALTAPVSASAESIGGAFQSKRSSKSVGGSFRFKDLFRGPIARGKVEAKIDLSDQRMTVYVGGRKYDSYPVSTARRGYVTPVGSWRPTRMHEMWRSRRYNMAPMPHSVFFKGGYAVHGTNHVRNLGRPASHGCVRLHPSDAKAFYNLVKANGMRNAKISVKH